MFSFIKYFFMVFVVLFIAGCSIKNVENKEEVKQEKKVELKREPITPMLLLTVNEIVKLIQNHDIKTLDKKYINHELGFFDIYKSKNNFFYERKLTLNPLEKDYFSIVNSIKRAKFDVKNLKIQKSSAIFSCSPNDDKYYGFKKQGLFLSDILDFPNVSSMTKKQKDKFSRDYALLVDKTSYKVVLTEAEIIFFLTKIEDKWYISLFDRASISCSST